MRVQSLFCFLTFTASTPMFCALTPMETVLPNESSTIEHQTETKPEPVALVQPKTVNASKTALEILHAAEEYKGENYVFGGRLGKRGCRRNGKPIQCRPGIDCQSLLFFAHEKVLGTRWWDFSVMPTVTVKNAELGKPVLGLDGVLRQDLDPTLLAPGDVLFFLFEDYNLDVDGPLLVDGEQKYGTWHTGFFYGFHDGEYQVLHAAPGATVQVQSMDSIAFDALFAVRM